MDKVKTPEPAQTTGDDRLLRRNADTFAEAERQGLMLAAQVRTVAMIAILLWAAIDSPNSGAEYYSGLMQISFFAILGVVQYLTARYRFHFGILKYVFVAVDCALLAAIFTLPMPFETATMPAAVAMDSSLFLYFFVILMQATFSLRPSLLLWCGFCMIAARTAMLLYFLQKPEVYSNLALPEQTVDAFLMARNDPNFLYLGFWATEMLVALIVSGGLAFVVARSRRLVERRVVAERSRASLARYFSPNVVDHIINTPDAIGTARTQTVAILFADIVGFSKMCEDQPAFAVIAMLRDYHDRIGQAVFDNGGTLDKYIGDGLMASFGTPEPGRNDARNALQAAMGMIDALARWNTDRRAEGLPEVQIGVGVNYGPVIAGDIGNARRLEYSVIGDSVNVASRLEHLTRELETDLVVSKAVIDAINPDDTVGQALLRRLRPAGRFSVKGREAKIQVWVRGSDPAQN